MFDNIIESLRKLCTPLPIVQQVDGRNYEVDQTPHGPQLGDLIVAPEKPVLALRSLTGFIDAYKAGIDGFDDGKTAIQVVDHLTVELVSLDADANGQRHRWLSAKCSETNPFPFGEYQVPERFLLNLQGGFLPTENIVQLQRLASNITTESSIGTQDDGFSQKVTMASSTVSKSEVVVPARLGLFAYRTFREVDPTESDFLVRFKGKQGELPTVALIEVDAGRWKYDTMLLVAKYLGAALPSATVIA